jgi:hypothetical protein
MGERVHAWIEFGPYDGKQLCNSETGAVLRDVIASYGFSETELSEVDGVWVLRCDDHEADYGTSALDGTNVFGEDLVSPAKAAGLWCMLGDFGGAEWARHHEVHAPDGRLWEFEGSGTSEVVLSFQEFVRLEKSVAPKSLGGAIDTHFMLGRRSLGMWVASEGTSAAETR